MGGGFCERHGPFDPPHRTCPFCARESDQRRTFGPPQRTVPASGSQPRPEPPATPPQEKTGEDEFVRQTVEPDRETNVTEMVPRPEIESDGGVKLAGEMERPPLGWLVIKDPLEKRGRTIPIQPNQTIGREGDIRWDDPRLSRLHARLTLELPRDWFDETSQNADDLKPVFYLWPFAPTNPVYINGQEVRGATALHENDEIRLGDTLLVFKLLMD